ncbi:hypothetical protein D3C76_956300 [compost metagenome]
MYQQAAQSGRLLSEQCHGLSVDQACVVLIGFGLVHCSIGCGVDDHVRGRTLDSLAQQLQITKIATQTVGRMPIKRHHFA